MIHPRLRTPALVGAPLLLLLLLGACTAGGASGEATASTSDAILIKCSPGFVPDCEPDILCFPSSPGPGDHCVVKNVCNCVPQTFPVAFPPIPSAGGGALAKLQLASIVFSGDQQYDGSATQVDADAFGRFLVGSSWLQTITSSYRSSSSLPATYLGTYVMPAYDGSSVVDVPTLLQQAVSSHVLTLPVDTTGLVYQVYIPAPGCNDGTASSGESEHEVATIDGVTVGWTRICGNAAWLAGNVAASHEIAETVTDETGSGYVFGNASTVTAWMGQGEVADVCEGTTGVTETSPTYGTYSLASIWSNKAVVTPGVSPCVPAAPSYANVSPSGPLQWNQWNDSWIDVLANQPVTVGLTGWTSGAPSGTSWTVTAQNEYPKGLGPAQLTLSQPTQPGLAVPASTGVTLEAGETTTLTFTAPAQTGEVYIEVASRWLDATGHWQSSTWPLLFDVIQ